MNNECCVSLLIYIYMCIYVLWSLLLPAWWSPLPLPRTRRRGGKAVGESRSDESRQCGSAATCFSQSTPAAKIGQCSPQSLNVHSRYLASLPLDGLIQSGPLSASPSQQQYGLKLGKDACVALCISSQSWSLGHCQAPEITPCGRCQHGNVMQAHSCSSFRGNWRGK